MDIPLDYVPFDAFAGLAISPNERYLYSSTPTAIHQFDLEAENIADSRLLIDTLENTPPGDFALRFNNTAIGSDNKIYIGGTLAFNHLHVIHEPNKQGLACNLEQYAIRLNQLPEASSLGMPNIPNFPDDFQVGTCDSMFVFTTRQQEEIAIEVFPNPVGDMLHIEVDFLKDKASITILDVLGVVQKESILDGGKTQLDVSDLSPGIYFYQIKSKGKILASDKLIVGN